MDATSSSRPQTAIVDTQRNSDLVLLRGLIRSRYHWMQFPIQLQHYFPQQRLLLPELAGNGERYRERTPFSINAMMEDLRQQVYANSDPTPKILIAISMGAMIATEWARCHPQEIQQLHLINTSFGNLSLPWQRMQAPAFLALLSRLHSRTALEKGIVRWTINIQHSPALIRQWQSFAQQHPLSYRNALAQLIAASGYRGPYTAPVNDTWLYNSMGDRLVNSNCTRAIAKCWQKPLHTHTSAGHDLPMDDGEWLAQRIFCNSVAQED